MTQSGSSNISLRGDATWRGMTTLTLGERGDRRFQLLENCYLSSDGSEIRTFPGWKTVVDYRTSTSDQAGASFASVGWDRFTTDAARPVYLQPFGGLYREHVTSYNSTWLPNTAITEALTVFSKPTHLHGFKFVRGKPIVYGEMDFRREPIYDATRTVFCTPTLYQVSPTFYDITLSNTADTVNYHFNAIWLPPAGTTVPTVVYIEGTGVSDLDGKFHRVTAVSGTPTVLRLATTGAPTGGAIGIPASGRVFRTRPGNTTPGVNGLPYVVSPFNGSLTSPYAGSTTVFNDTARSLSTNQLVGMFLQFTSGVNTGKRQTIASNTATTITTAAFTVGSSVGDNYVVDGFDPSYATDDPAALTVWTQVDPFNVNDLSKTYDVPGSTGNGTLVSWVANRQRDFGDQAANLVGGTETAGGSKTLWTAAIAANYTANSLAGLWLQVLTGSNAGARQLITANNGTTTITTVAFNNNNGINDTFIVGGYIQEGSITSGLSRRAQKRIPYRLVPDVAGERLLLGAPGYGCVFQVPRLTSIDQGEPSTPDSDGIPYRNNDVFDKPRSLGIPKATMFEDTNLSPASSYHVYNSGATAMSFGGSHDATEQAKAGTYQFKVAYRDDATGEIGLCSEPISITTDGASLAYEGIRLAVLHPGYLMGETLAGTIVLYRTAKNGSDFFYVGPVNGSFATSTMIPSMKYGICPDGATAGTNQYWHYIVEVPYVSDTILGLSKTAVPTIEQMPMGVKALKTVRNYTFFGGFLGNAGSRRELWQSGLSFEYDNANLPNYDEVYSKLVDATAGTTRLTGDGSWNCAANCIPPAYVEAALIYSNRLFPYPTFSVELDKLRNTKTPSVGAPATPLRVYAYQVRYGILSTPLSSGNTRSGGFVEKQNAWLTVDRGLFQISEENAPGVVDSHLGFVNAEKEEDIEAIGQAFGSVVFCTRSNTYVTSWSRTPFLDQIAPQQPDTSMAEFGCIAPNTMVEYDGGCAWLSDRGPVAYTPGQGIDWISRDLERFFVGDTARYKRDSEGMMRHAWACHDAERGLIYFGLFADRNALLGSRVTVSYLGSTYNWDTANPVGTFTADEAKSRFPCDEILAWNYRLNAWSRWVPPSGLEVLWMERGYDAAGAQRVFVLANDWRIYALDDSFSDINQHVLALTPTNNGTNSTALTVASGAFGTDETARDVADNFLRVGTGILIKSSDNSIRGYTTVSACDSFAGTITLADAMTWSTTDTVYCGIRQATLTTNAFNFTGAATPVSGRKLVMRYNLFGNHGTAGAITASLVVNKRVAGAELVPDNRTTPSLTGELPALWLGSEDLTKQTARAIDLAKGLGTGQEIQLSATIYHGGQVRISDFALEVP